MPMVEREMTASGDAYKWLKVAALFLLTAGVLVFIVYLVAGREMNGVADFRSCYLAGMKIRTGNVFSLYDVSSYPQFAPFVRAAWEALIFVPFVFFPYQAAFVIWTLVSLFLFGMSGWLMRDELWAALVTENRLLRKISVLALLIPIGTTLAVGEDAALFLLLIVLALRSARVGRDFDAGIWLGLASIDLHLLIPLFLLIVLRKRWRMVESIALTGTFLFLISTALAGPYWVTACIHAQASVADQLGFETARWLLVIVGVRRFIPLFLVAGVLVSLWLVRRMAFERAAAWLIVSAIFFNWHSFLFDYSSALPAIVLRKPGGLRTQ